LNLRNRWISTKLLRCSKRFRGLG